MFRRHPPAISSIRRFGPNLVASSALVLAATLIAVSAASDASAAQVFNPSGAASKFGPNPGKLINVKKGMPRRPPGVSSVGGMVPGTPGSVKTERGGPPPVRNVGIRTRPPVVGAGTVINLGAPPTGGGPKTTPQISRRPSIGVPPAGERNYVPDEVIIELAANTSDQAAAALARRFRLTQLDSFDFQLAGTKLYRWRISDRRTVPAVVRAIEADRTAISISPNYIVHLNDAGIVAAATSPMEQYALAKLQVPQAHALARGGNVLIAIIDGGVDVSHPELAGVIADTFDAIGKGDKIHPHGTAVAGAIAAQARLTGTAPAARILAARAFDRGQTEGHGYDVAKAFQWAVGRGARIINMSFAGPRVPQIEVGIREARKQGVIVVASVGNKGPLSPPLYPAADPNVIAVTATDEDDKVFHAANRGRHIAVAAPGVELLLPGLGGTYQQVSGTSFASAEVAGTIALLLEQKPDLGHDDVRRILMSTARDLGPRGVDPHFGAGLVDAYRALLSIAPTLVGSSTPAEGPAQN